MRIPFARRTRVLLTLASAAALTLVVTTLARGPAEALDGPVEVVYVADGRNFPDSLAGATLAATAGAPLLMVKPDLPVPSETTAALAVLDPDRIVILGGPLAVSHDVADALVPYATTGEVTRLFGASRYGTAAAIADAVPEKVHDADLLDGQDSEDFTMLWVTVHSDATVLKHSPGLEGVWIDRPGDEPMGVYCLHLPEGLQRPSAALVSVEDSYGGSQDYGAAATTSYGHACNDRSPWDIAVDTTVDGALDNAAFTLMFPAGQLISL